MFWRVSNSSRLPLKERGARQQTSSKIILKKTDLQKRIYAIDAKAYSGFN
jgi:hypothetical protein